MQTVAGSRFGAIGQPAPPAQRKIFTEAQINKLVCIFFPSWYPIPRFLLSHLSYVHFNFLFPFTDRKNARAFPGYSWKYFKFEHVCFKLLKIYFIIYFISLMFFLQHSSREEVRNVLNELERRPLLLASDVTFSSVLSHVSSCSFIFYFS